MLTTEEIQKLDQAANLQNNEIQLRSYKEQQFNSILQAYWNVIQAQNTVLYTFYMCGTNV